jgi:hypothetical protein
MAPELRIVHGSGIEDLRIVHGCGLEIAHGGAGFLH